jgi:hypothetical protein
MYGGQTAGALDDIWALDLTTNTWTDLTPVSRPAGRFFTAHVYDEINHRATIFGGSTNSGLTGEVWVFDLWQDAWTQLLPGAGPSAREGSAGVYDRANDRMIVFCGKDPGWKNEVWALENLSNTVTSVGDDAPRSGVTLHQNFPNPFNPTTTISYAIDAPSHVSLRIYDLRGHVVRTLVDRTQPAGSRSIAWDGRDDAGNLSATGVYFYRLLAGGQDITKRMVLLK